MDVNVIGLCLCTRETVASMRERKVDDGQIIHISRYELLYIGADINLVYYCLFSIFHFSTLIFIQESVFISIFNVSSVDFI